MASRLTDAEKQGHQYRWLPRKCKRSVQPIKTLATVRTARLINARLWKTNFWLWEFKPWYQSNLSSKLILSLLRKVANLWWKFQKHESPKSWLPWCLFHHCPSVCAFQRRLGSLADWTAIQMPCQFWVCGESWVFLQLLTARPFKHNTRSQVFKFRIKQSLVTDSTGEHRSGFFQPDLAVAPPAPHSSLRSMPFVDGFMGLFRQVCHVASSNS